MKSAPISRQERIVTIDIIRGFALFGIFLVNMPAFHSPVFLDQFPDYTGMDYWLDLLLQMFVQTKFYTIFSFLFGLGFYIFMSRAEQRSLHVNRLFSKRLAILLLIGVVHFIFIWYGDILHTYAIAGFFLLLFYKRKVKTLLIWAFSLLFVFYALVSSQFLIPASQLEEIQHTIDQENETKLVEYVEMYEQGAYWDWVSYRIQTEIIPQAAQLPIILFPVLAMFLFGLCAGKIEIFQPDTPHLSKIKWIWLITLLLSIPLAAMVGLLKMEILNFGVYHSNSVFLFTGLSGVSLCFFYMSSLTLLLRKKSWQRLLRPLGYTGQMALTNYLTQTFISVFIFLGLNYYGNVSLTAGTFICLVIFVIQVVFSFIWLKYFRFGPLEWLWRSLTYGYFQPMKIKKVTNQVTEHTGLNH